MPLLLILIRRQTSLDHRQLLTPLLPLPLHVSRLLERAKLPFLSENLVEFLWELPFTMALQAVADVRLDDVVCVEDGGVLPGEVDLVGGRLTIR